VILSVAALQEERKPALSGPERMRGESNGDLAYSFTEIRNHTALLPLHPPIPPILAALRYNSCTKTALWVGLSQATTLYFKRVQARPQSWRADRGFTPEDGIGRSILSRRFREETRVPGHVFA